jgi:hypothetical protein
MVLPAVVLVGWSAVAVFVAGPTIARRCPDATSKQAAGALAVFTLLTFLVLTISTEVHL